MAGSFNSRWGISQSDDEVWHEFINRLQTLFELADFKIDGPKSKLFAFRLGVKDYEVLVGSRDGLHKLNLVKLFNDGLESAPVARNIEAILNILEPSDAFINTLKNLIDKTSCGFRFVKTEDGWLTYPTSETELDSNLVEPVLSYLEGQALEEFTMALRLSKSKSESVLVSEKTRRTLEEYLRHKLGTRKGLTNAIDELGQVLKAGKVSDPIRSMIINELKALDTHYNDSSKHNSKTERIESEYLVYKVANLIRLVNEAVAD